MKSLRIAFGCQARVGKSEATGYLIKKFGGIELTFANPLYEILHFSQEICNFPKIKDREFLQYIGTDWARKKDPDVWVKCLSRKLDSIDPKTNIFISDVRFPNEFSMLKERGFIMVKIVRSFEDSEFRAHKSENALLNCKDWDYEIDNNSSLENLYSSLNSIVKLQRF